MKTNKEIVDGSLKIPNRCENRRAVKNQRLQWERYVQVEQVQTEKQDFGEKWPKEQVAS
jgi:hypothetical protein